MLKACCAGLLAAFLLVATPALAETLTNASIVQLTRAGLGADAIVAKIRASDTRFDTSTDAMVALKRQDVPDAVIAAMVASSSDEDARESTADRSDPADPAAAHAAGVYVVETGASGHLQRLDPTLADDTRTSNVFGWFFTHGAIPLLQTTVLDGPSARVHADAARPTFYFYFNQPGSGLYENGIGQMRLDGHSPSLDPFTLVHFQVVGGNRQAIIRQFDTAGAHEGGVDSVRVGFTVAAVGQGVFAVTPDADLAPGEYAFVVTPAADDDDNVQARYFDFSTAE